MHTHPARASTAHTQHKIYTHAPTEHAAYNQHTRGRAVGWQGSLQGEGAQRIVRPLQVCVCVNGFSGALSVAWEWRGVGGWDGFAACSRQPSLPGLFAHVCVRHVC